MPRYHFHNKKTKQEWVDFMMIAEMEEMLEKFSERALDSLRRIDESQAKNNLEVLVKFTEFKA